jgi:hypothetical protein
MQQIQEAMPPIRMLEMENLRLGPRGGCFGKLKPWEEQGYSRILTCIEVHWAGDCGS